MRTVLTLPMLAILATGCTPTAVSNDDPGAAGNLSADTSTSADGSLYYFVARTCDTGAGPCQGWTVRAANRTTTECAGQQEADGCTTENADIARNWDDQDAVALVRGTFVGDALSTTEAYEASGDPRGYPVYRITPTERGYHRDRLNSTYASDFDFIVSEDGSETISDYAAGYVGYDAATDTRTFTVTARYTAASVAR